MPLLDVSEKDWEKANHFFQAFPHEVKMPKEQHHTSFSFIHVGGVIYAKKTGEALGRGVFGRVKVVQNQAKENFAVKIERRGARGEEEAEAQIMDLLQILQGEAERAYDTNLPKYEGRKIDTHKLYTVMTLYKGETMSRHLYQDRKGFFLKPLSQEQKLIYAIKAAEAIELLHRKRIIHSDIKPDNFMANNENDMITVTAIDFGLSRILPPDQNSVPTLGGQVSYRAPENLNWPHQCSFASDIYSLGVVFIEDLGLPYMRYLINDDPAKRPSLTEVLDRLYQKLKDQPNLSEQSEEMLAKREESLYLRSDSTPLIHALKNLDASSVLTLALVKYSADVNAKDSAGNTALMLAALNGLTYVCSTLIERGANLNDKDHNGDTALTLAASSGESDTCLELIENGAIIDIENATLIQALKAFNLPTINEAIETQELVSALRKAMLDNLSSHPPTPSSTSRKTLLLSDARKMQDSVSKIQDSIEKTNNLTELMAIWEQAVQNHPYKHFALDQSLLLKVKDHLDANKSHVSMKKSTL